MPERNIEFGKYGARGIKGHEAVARQLDALAGHIATPSPPGEASWPACTTSPAPPPCPSRSPRRRADRHRPHPARLDGRHPQPLEEESGGD
ncbi:hypothetical protein M2160_000129 [Streptomyces sp. SAI-117]|nr:hypothetical protein [Streptomyces sp. SAI-117]